MNEETKRVLLEIAEEIDQRRIIASARYSEATNVEMRVMMLGRINEANEIAQLLRQHAGEPEANQSAPGPPASEPPAPDPYCDDCGGYGMSKYGTKPPICDVCGRALVVGLHAPTICQSCAKAGGGKQGATSAEPEPTPNVAWVKSVFQDCCRNKDISRETAKEIVAALLRDTGGIDFDFAAVTPEEKEADGAKEFAAALLRRIADELDEYGSERAAQHLRRHAAKLKEDTGD